MRFADLIQFIERDMRMSHVYQPVMLRLLLNQNGRASVADIARALLNEDRSQLDYYSEITKNMVDCVLSNRKLVTREGNDYKMLDYSELAPDEIQ
jgi:ATP adenylyltransferase